MNRQLLDTIQTELNAGKRCMLATVVERHGSAPRGAGTSMVVSDSGEQTGTVGGGALEYRVRQDALALLNEGTCAVRSYDIHADDHQAYSGSVTILFRPFEGKSGKQLAEQIEQAFEQDSESYLACRLLNGYAETSSVHSAESLCACAGLSGPPEQPVLADEAVWFIEPLRDAPRVILFGGGHVSQKLALQLNLLDLRIWVVEDRESFASETLFPTAERVIFCNYDKAEERLNITKRDHAVVMSRGHETDYQILRWLLRSKADYIGCIGSKRKIALTRERLLADGASEAQLDRLHAPVGLAIGAETPAEIAVSIAAELIAYCANK